MIEGIKGTRAYDNNGKEVSRVGRADILFIDTREAARALYRKEEDGGFDSYIANDEYPFDENNPGIYVRNPYNDFWYSIERYNRDIQEGYSYCKSINSLVKELEERGGN